MKNNLPPILVTGSHRSGSTWVGKMLALPSEVKYISEPFNPIIGIKKINKWFLYINDKNEAEYQSEIERLLKFMGDVPFNLPAVKYWLNALRPGKKRPLLKDPIAAMSSDWLSSTFNMQVVVLLRHPAAFHSSLKRVNWHFDFNNFLDQTELMSDHLSSLKPLIEKPNKTYVEEAGILWLCIYRVLDAFSQKHPDWIVVRHEDLSRNPVEEYQKLYQKLDLEFTNKIKAEIIKTSGGHNSAEAKQGQALDLNRDSRGLIKSWQKHLSQEEIKRIRELTEPLAHKYYSDQDW